MSNKLWGVPIGLALPTRLGIHGLFARKCRLRAPEREVALSLNNGIHEIEEMQTRTVA